MRTVPRADFRRTGKRRHGISGERHRNGVPGKLIINQLNRKSEEQRIVIAEACGFETYISAQGNVVFQDEEPPDYTSDLNAMHDAVMSLSNTKFHKWKQVLSLMIVGTKHMPPTRDYLCATPAQRAEAFLRALDLWKEQN